jgi:FtsP/CotA-like multicopper oxidase with cupredoxin domain
MDIADIAYDYFLTKGHPETQLEAHPGETVRLRVINGSATTYFHLNFSGGPMTITGSDGQLVQTVESDLFLIAVAEIYDVLVTTPDEGAYEFRATAHDGSGCTSTWLGAGTRYPAKTIPKPNLYEPMEHGGMGSILALTPAGAMGMSDKMVNAGAFDKPGMSHGGHDAAAMDRSHEKAHSAHGTMDHGASSMDQKPGHEGMEHSDTYHPMHLHGHFFRVINGQGDHAPLKNVVDVPPMSTTVIEFYSDEVGDWLFHCHLLYHMKSGMTRMIHYENFEPSQ